MTYAELKKLLKKQGCYKTREGANHEIWYSPKTGRSFPVGRHSREEVVIKTYNSIKKDAGLE